MQGTIKHTLHLSESDGPAVTLDVTGPYVVCSTRNGVVRIWDLSKRDARQSHYGPTPPSLPPSFQIWSGGCVTNMTNA